MQSEYISDPIPGQVGHEADELSQLRCYERLQSDYVAFERNGEICYGPISRLAAFLSGSGETFLTGDAALAKIRECQAQQRPARSAPHPVSETDGLSLTRKRWQQEWGKFSRTA
jgi:hypothetical protein